MKSFLLYIVLFCSLSVKAQHSKTVLQRQHSREAVKKISSALEQNLPPDSIAANYEQAAYTFLTQKDYERANEYLEQAKKNYFSAGNQEKVALIEREIAKLYEQTGEYEKAIENYLSAMTSTQDTLFREVNMNDARRLNNMTNPENTIRLANKNLELFSNSSRIGSDEQRRERSLAYRQIAQANTQQNNNYVALTNLQFALDEVKEFPAEARIVKMEMADILVAEDQIKEAIHINQDILEEAKQEQNTRLQIEQLQNLSSNYSQTEEEEKAMKVLEEAYDVAVEAGHTLEAAKTLQLLIEQYQKRKNTKKQLEIYESFLEKLETLIRKDSSLIDESFFRVHEERIAQMEKEKELQDELIKKQSTFNNILLLLIFVIILSLLFITKALYSIKKKNKRIALQSLRREMNPHFIFNSLNSVNQFIAQNKEVEANRYLTSYSRLMRNMMEHSNQDFIALSTEIEQIRKYLELEYMRFPEKFNYRIEIDETIDCDSILIPNMLIQPQVENAIWHGLRYLNNGGELILTIHPDGKIIKVIIEDNGIGLEKSKQLKTEHQKSRQSRGQQNTRERIRLLNDLYNCHIRMEIKDKTNETTGVIVQFYFPLQIKKQ